MRRREPMSNRLARLPILVTIAIAVVVTGCATVAEMGVHPLVTVEFRGGLCADGGTCSSVTYLNSDGTVTGATKPPNDLGTMTPGVLARLQAAIAQADFTALAAKPFTGTCPTAFDGQEAVFTFHLPSGDVRLAQCEVDLDPDAPLFLAVAEALRAGEGPSN